MRNELSTLGINILEQYSKLFSQLTDINSPVVSKDQLSLHTGTTIIGSFYDHGKKLIMAADRKAAYVSPNGGVTSIATLEARKVYSIGKHHCFGGAGIGTFIFRLGQEMEFINKRFNQDRSYPISGFGLAGIMRQFSTAITMRMGEVCGFILCSIKPHPVIFDISSLHVEKKEKYHIIGSGSKSARPVFNRNWRFDMDEEEILNLTIDTCLEVKRSDVGSGWDDDNAPTIMLLRDEVTELAEERITEIIEERKGKFKDNRGRKIE